MIPRLQEKYQEEIHAKLRGLDKYGHFALEPDPVSNLDDAARTAHEESYKAYRANYNEQLAWHHEGRSH